VSEFSRKSPRIAASIPIVATRKEPLNKFDRLERKFTVVVDEFIESERRFRDASNRMDALDDTLSIKKS